MARIAAFLQHDAPFEHGIFSQRQDALCIEHRPNLECQPVLQGGSLFCVCAQFNVVSDLSQADDADVEMRKRIGNREVQNFLIGFWLS